MGPGESLNAALLRAGGLPRRDPPALLRERALLTAGISRRAHERTELHDRGVPLRGLLAVFGNEGVGSRDLVLAQILDGGLHAMEASQHTADIGVEYGGALAIGEGDDGIGGVGANPRKGYRDRRGHEGSSPPNCSTTAIGALA